MVLEKVFTDSLYKEKHTVNRNLLTVNSDTFLFQWRYLISHFLISPKPQSMHGLFGGGGYSAIESTGHESWKVMVQIVQTIVEAFLLRYFGIFCIYIFTSAMEL